MTTKAKRSTSARKRAAQTKNNSKPEILKAPTRGASAMSKQSQVLALLRRKEGATIEALMQTTGWQQHSVRGFFAGVIRKKLGLDLTSEKTDAGRVYRLPNAETGSTAPSTKQAKGTKPGNPADNEKERSKASRAARRRIRQ